MCFKKTISLAVVGIKGSGKSYLLSDIISSFSTLGFNSKPASSKMYGGIVNFKAKIESDGRLSQTEMYACRPGENIYGTTYVGHGRRFELNFVDIPGEVFGGQKIVNGNTYLTVFNDYRQNLEKNSTKLFTVSVWKNDFGNELKIVEPILVLKDKRKEEQDKYKKADGYFDNSQFMKNRKNSFQGWDEIFRWLKHEGYKEPNKPHETFLGKKKITGKELLKNFYNYQPDSLMMSLAELVHIIAPGLGIEQSDFINGYNREAFYFLYYCSKATDIVLCDRLFVPDENGECKLDTRENYQAYTNITKELYDFILTYKTNVYLAFRGMDYLLKTQETHFMNLIDTLRNIPKNDDEIRNIVYSIPAYLLWNHVDSRNVAKTDAEFRNEIGIVFMKKFGIVDINGKFVDFAVINKVDLRNVINPHIGATSSDAFRHLLQAAYGFSGPKVGNPMFNMPPHVFFTCTPITNDFEVYINDKDSNNQRFIKPQYVGTDKESPAKYFDTAGSHFCFGTYQLCIDILYQHKFGVLDYSNFGNLIFSSISN